MSTPAEVHDLTAFDVNYALALEIASQLTPPMEVFRRHGLEEADAKALLANPKFQQLLKQAHAEWNAESNTADRIRLKAQMCLEQLLMPMFQTARSTNTPIAARNETTKIFKDLSGITQREEGGGGGAVFKLTINLGNDDAPREIKGATLEHDDAGV